MKTITGVFWLEWLLLDAKHCFLRRSGQYGDVFVVLFCTMSCLLDRDTSVILGECDLEKVGGRYPVGRLSSR
jgi:hypothetical protein